MDFREYVPIDEGDEVVLVGTIRDPVHWDFSIRVCEDDIAGMTRLIFSKPILKMLFRQLFRSKKHHWTQEHAEHLEEGRQRRATAEEKAVDRIAANEEARLAALAEAATEEAGGNTEELSKSAAPKA